MTTATRFADLPASDQNWFRKAGVTTMEAAQPWIENGINGAEYWCFNHAGVVTLAEAQVWTSAGIHGPECFYFHQVGVVTLDEVLAWTSVGIDSYHCVRFREAGVTDPRAARQWFDAGFDGQTFSALVVSLLTALRATWGDSIIDRVLERAAWCDVAPIGTLRALRRSNRLGRILDAATDTQLDTAIVLAEQQHRTTGKVDVQFIIESLTLLD